jgi:hypothetical protein
MWNKGGEAIASSSSILSFFGATDFGCGAYLCHKHVWWYWPKVVLCTLACCIARREEPGVGHTLRSKIHGRSAILNFFFAWICFVAVLLHWWC